MKRHTQWIALYTTVVLILALLAGFGVDHGRTTESTHGSFLRVDNITHSDEQSLDELYPHVHFDDLDYLVRFDLGYPRIESVVDSYEQVIKRYATRYEFDWRLILAVMNQESRFETQAVSHRGAFGLMQIMPITGEEISSSLGIDGILLPEDNIAGGIYYLWRLYNLFDPVDEHSEANSDVDRDYHRLRLALAAYNGGPTRVQDAQAIARYLNLNPYRWEIVRDVLPMLSRRYASLHRYVWDTGRPRGGYFEGFDETINYVNKTIEYYSYYRQLFK